MPILKRNIVSSQVDRFRKIGNRKNQLNVIHNGTEYKKFLEFFNVN